MTRSGIRGRSHHYQKTTYGATPPGSKHVERHKFGDIKTQVRGNMARKRRGMR